jgi:hypothetical protein
LALQGVLLVAVGVLAAPLSVRAQPAPATPAIQWPTPSQPPGTVTFHSRHPTEAAWDPALAQFAQERGTAVEEMAAAARQYAQSAGRAPKAALAPGRRRGTFPPSAAKLLRIVDIVRLPVLPVAEMPPHVSLLRSQLEGLSKGGFDRAVWEVTDLPADETLADWTDACLGAFPQPPVLMLGWHLANGRIAPAHDQAARFIESCAPRCHSVMLTGEELNTQFYATPDGGRALPFLRYWAGVVRTHAPRAFLWCRLDEMVSSQRPNARQEAWVRELLPLCDGLAYQVHHGEQDVRDRRRVSEQFQAVERVVAELRRAGAWPPRQCKDKTCPVLLGGFVALRAAVPGQPGFGVGRMAAELRTYEDWLSQEAIAGYIRYVGMLPAEPVAELVAHSLPTLAAAAPAQEAPATPDGAPPNSPPGP